MGGWGGAGGEECRDWTGGIFNEYPGISHILPSCIFLMEKPHWVVGGREMGYLGKKKERR